jgi:predicted GTPase
VKHLKLWWTLVLTLLSIPYLVLFTVGSLWLFQYGMLWEWLGISAVCTVAGWVLARWLRPQEILTATIRPGEAWPASGQEAWKQVESLALRIQQENPSVDRPERIWEVLREVLETVARHYHPNSSLAVLEIPAPHVLRIVELVAHDLRETFASRVPGSHILTLNDLRRLGRWATLSQHFYLVYKILIFGLNPVAGLLREVRDAASGGLAGVSGDEVKRWAWGFCVRKAGYYAIQLYSGHLVLDDVQVDRCQTRRSQQDARQADAQQEQLAEEPLRILVLGQVKAGKSSLINALFGETRAAVDVVPRTRNVEPYVLNRQGIPQAIILDTAGYAGDLPGEGFDEAKRQILQCDLVLMVCSAQSASRDADRRLLDAVRRFYQSDPDRIMPPVVSVLTHIDQLRPFTEWNPPYDLAQPTSVKARNMGDAVTAVAQDLGLGDDEPVIPVCLKPEQWYNVEEGLAPAILQSASEAQRVRYLRCLREYHQEEYWQRLWQQAVHSGRILAKLGVASASRILGKSRGK